MVVHLALPSDTTNRPTQTLAGRFASIASNHHFSFLPSRRVRVEKMKKVLRAGEKRQDGGGEGTNFLTACDGWRRGTAGEA